MIQKPVDDIKKSDIEALIQNQVSEGRTIEYKQVLPSSSDDDKREFLADVSSFANAGGGDLFYGISAKDGIPYEALGLEGNFDDEKLRLENLNRDNLDPRIPGVRMQPVSGFKKGFVLLIRIPKSWNAPHIVKFKNLSRFFTRNSAGKYQMDVSEIRAAFLLSDALPERMKRFRDERLGRIIADETPVPLQKGARLILHILPVASFTGESNIDVSALKQHGRNGLRPIGSNGYNHRVNLDGYVTFDGDFAGNNMASYCQIFRKGQIEAVCADIVREHPKHKGHWLIPSTAYEKYVIEAVLCYIGVLKALEVPSPLFLFLSLTGVSGAYMGVSSVYLDVESSLVDRDTLVLPDILIEDYERLSSVNEVAGVIRPAFDVVWNACGYEGSFNFDEKGDWRPR